MAEGRQGIGARRAEGAEQRSGLVDARAFSRFGEFAAGSVGLIPSDVPIGLTFWVDGADAATIDDTTAPPDVDQWGDKSASGFDQSQGTAAAKPHTGADMGGVNALEFDGTDDFLRHNVVGGGLSGTKGTIFVVFELDVLSGTMLASANSLSTNTYGALSVSGSGDLTLSLRNGAFITLVDSNTTTMVTGTRYLVSCTSDGSSYSMWINGVEQALSFAVGTDDGDWFATVFNRDNLAVGSLQRSIPAGFVNGRIGEEAVWDGVDLTSEEFTGLTVGFAAKWGITLP